MQGTPVKLDSIRALRGVAVLMVLMAHLFSIEGKYAGDPILGDWLLAGFAGVDLFFVISGFIMVYVTQGVGSGLSRGTKMSLPQGGAHRLGVSARFLFARIVRIYPLYWVVTLALLLVWIKYPAIVFASSGQDFDLIRSFLLLPDEQLPLLAVGWTLVHEMYFYLLFALALLLPRKFLLWFLLSAALLGAVGYWQSEPQLSALQKIVFSPLTFEFLGGALVAAAMMRWQFKIWPVLLAVASFGFILAMVYANHVGSAVLDSHLQRTLVFAPTASLLVLALVVMEQCGKTFPKILIWVGDQSYSLYLTHVLSLSLVGKIWAMIAVPGIWDNLIAIPILLVSSLLIGQATYVLLERPLLRQTNKYRKKLR